MRPLLLAACLLLGPGACARLPSTACVAGAEASIADTLYFGLAIPSGGEVDEAQWRAFLRDEVTPRFPQGLSVVEAAGQWRGADGLVVREPARVLTLVHAGSAAEETAVRTIVANYKQRFAQEAVLRLRQPTCASF